MSEKAIYGAVAALAADAAWSMWSGSKGVEAGPLGFIEHYHIGLGLLAVKRPFTDGAGATLISLEAKSRVLGTESPSVNPAAENILGSILGGLVLIRRCV